MSHHSSLACHRRRRSTAARVEAVPSIAHRVLFAALLWAWAASGLLGQSLPSHPAERAESSAAAGHASVAVPPWLTSRLDRVVEDGIRKQITPGATLVIGFGGQIALTRSWGRLDWAATSPDVTDSTVYDLASVTKAVATTTAAMKLVEDGRLELDAVVASYLPGWPSSGAKGSITIRQLLEHTSGLPGAARLWRSNQGRDAYLKAIGELRLQGTPGEVQIYSDLGMIVLALAVEEITGQTLDHLTTRWVTEPLTLRETAFRPLRAGIERAAIAPTELNPNTGKKTQGTVHDLNAHALGGVAGHAGLFGSARDLATFASAILWESPAPLACASTVRRFAHRDDPSSRFGLGWEMPVPEVIWSDFFTDDAFGHTGYTGTSLWIDPNRDLFVVFLTNRVNPTAKGDAIHDLRRWVHRAVHGWVVDPMSAPAAARAAAAASEAAPETVATCTPAGGS